jgi:SAM-dependent methyltransferase
MDRDDEQRWTQRELVRSGYDAISMAYRDDQGQADPSRGESTTVYKTWLDELAGLLSDAARVLDLGCGAGVPACRILADRCLQVTGLEISAVQIERARHLVPQATFVQADMATWDCEPGSFQAIVTLYALIHVPLDDQRHLFSRMAQWLCPGGYLLAIVGYERWTGVEEYMGAPMFWDHAPTLRRTSAGCQRLGCACFGTASSRKERQTTRSFLPSQREQQRPITRYGGATAVYIRDGTL